VLADMKRNRDSGCDMNINILVFVAGKAQEGLRNMTCLQDCRYFHDWRSVNQRLLKVKCAEFMGCFSNRETCLVDPILQSVCEGLFRHSYRKEGNPLTMCKGRNIVNTRLYSLIVDFLISSL